MNSIKILFLFPLLAFSNLALGADSYGGKQGDYGPPNQANAPGRMVYNSVAKLKGYWVLAPAAQQEGGATKKGPAAKIIGTDKTAMNFKLVGKGTTVQESLLPDTPKEMVTMYHCKDKTCNTLAATHYCAKKNQSQLQADITLRKKKS